MSDLFLPGNPLDEEIRRISVYGGDIVEFKFLSGHIERRTAQELRDFLAGSQNVDEDILIKRCKVEYEIGHVVGYDHFGKRQYGVVRLKAASKQRGSYCHISMLNEGPEFGVERTLDDSHIKSVMTQSSWILWTKREIPLSEQEISQLAARGKRKDGTYDHGYLVDYERGFAQGGSYALTIEPLEVTKSRKIYSGMTWKKCQKVSDSLIASGVNKSRIRFYIETSPPNYIAFFAFFYRNPLAKKLLPFLRFLHPHMRFRKCHNNKGYPKKVYATKEEAMNSPGVDLAFKKHPDKNLGAYWCVRHCGFHLGND